MLEDKEIQLEINEKRITLVGSFDSNFTIKDNMFNSKLKKTI